MPARRRNTAIHIVILLAVVSLAYSNHFHNPFHFDDSHAIVDNPYIRDLRNTALFFTDARTFSNLPSNRAYRPLIPLSLAIDYRLGRGLTPIYFQASTFLWFLAQLVLMYALFRKLCDSARPDPRNAWLALMATALYGLHPAMAETVNYVIQRGDVYSTLGVIAGLLIYAAAPPWRRFGLYLIPVAAGILSKPPALIFPAILFAYILLFEEAKPLRALRRCVPALVAAAALGYLTSAMTPKVFNPGGASGWSYRITQPLVALRYFRTFFIPDRLSADSDLSPVTNLWQDGAWLGFVFVAAVILVAIFLSRRKPYRPAAFGLWWFLLALLPTSLYPLAEVENDHRMFFPFAGLVLAVCWPIALWLYDRPPLKLAGRAALAGACLTVLIAYASATWQRNQVWHSDESLWYNVILKSPHNGRALMNYGLTQMAKGETLRALDFFEQALVYTPSYFVLETNLGIANGALHRDAAAGQHFQRAIELAPNEATEYFFYARWLRQKGLWPSAMEQLHRAIALNPDYLPPRYLLMETLAQHSDWDAVSAQSLDTLHRFPGDPTAAQYLTRARSPMKPAATTADDYLNRSVSAHRAGKYQESIDAARESLKLQPDFPEAYNNIAAAYEALGSWDAAIDNAHHALHLRPDFILARNNLAWAEGQKKKQQAQ